MLKKQFLNRVSKKWRIAVALIAVLAIGYYFILPEKLFTTPYSTVLESDDGALLSATITEDGQWRFPAGDSVPRRFVEAITTFEDKRFFWHPGVDVLAVFRAIRKNLASGEIVSGASTITMQVIRLSRNGQSRTFLEKMYEMILATRLEWRNSKEEILNLYAAHAPFGANVVGLEAAAWRYFGTSPHELSWAQTALLAVLPNAPSLIHPGKNRGVLKKKRDRLLDVLMSKGSIDSLTCALAKAEPIPPAPLPLPRTATHLLHTLRQKGFEGQRIVSTVKQELQLQVEALVNQHHVSLKAKQIHNAAVLVLNVSDGTVLAYAGNVTSDAAHENDVDLVQARRSTGSILKPFLYAAMLDAGKILPSTIIPDVPLLLSGFAPKNFTHQYDGAVKSDEALVRSLNVPYVHLLRQYNNDKFYQLLKKSGMTTLSKSADHYGLSLILGGAEATLWDLAGMYASMARTLSNYHSFAGSNRYRREDFFAPQVIQQHQLSTGEAVATSWLSASSIYLTFETLTGLSRPAEEQGWKHFTSSKKIAWKTGTSFGFRDAWSIGVTADYVVAVWVGNADGEGRPGLTGTETAAPLMFDIFATLPASPWFKKPYGEMQEALTCAKSGHLASNQCVEVDTVWVPQRAVASKPCPYHVTVHLTEDKKYRVHDLCEQPARMKHLSWFVLPAVQEYYYKKIDQGYQSLPPFATGCITDKKLASMDLVYPTQGARIYLPVQLSGERSTTVFQVVHRDKSARVYWHLDGQFMFSTQRDHKIPFSPTPGKHVLSVVDESGEVLERNFEVIRAN